MSAFHLLLNRSISYLKYNMEGICCKIFIAQFTFIGNSYINDLFPLNFLHHLLGFSYIENDLFSRFQHFYEEMSFPKSQISIYFLYNL